MRRPMVLATSLILAGAVAAADCPSDSVQLRGDWGQLRFSVEIADDDAERSRGLMFREEMARSAGMLFVFEYPQTVSFWMKNTLIPLDMIFLDDTGTVVKVHHEAVPGDATAIPGGDNVLAVLEINGGLAERYGIGAGSELQHGAFGKDAAWPCN